MAHIRGLKEKGIEYSIEVSGKRGTKFMNFQKIAFTESYTHFEDQPKFSEVEVLASRYVEDYIAGRLIAWMWPTRSSSARQNNLPCHRIHCCRSPAWGGIGDKAEKPVDYEFLPSAQEILAEIVPAAFRAKLFKCFLDAAVSEQIARMVAMKGATENADEMAGTLKQQYNRARQAGITSELAEIIGGAAALE